MVQALALSFLIMWCACFDVKKIVWEYIYVQVNWPSENAKKISALHNILQTQVNKINGLVDQLAKEQAQKNMIEQELKQEQLKISKKWKVVTRMIAITSGTAPIGANSWRYLESQLDQWTSGRIGIL